MLVPALRRFLPLLGSRPPQLTGSDDEIERLHPHGATRLKRQCELAQSGAFDTAPWPSAWLPAMPGRRVLGDRRPPDAKPTEPNSAPPGHAAGQH
jgi:hypothetical protein